MLDPLTVRTFAAAAGVALAVSDATVVVPVSVGPTDKTTDPAVPVADVVAVPPRATASVPDPALSMFRDVIPDPAPIKVVAVTVPVTSRAVPGFVFPMPTFPARVMMNVPVPVLEN